MVGGDQPADDMNNAAVVADSNPTLVVGLLPVGRVAPDVRVNQERLMSQAISLVGMVMRTTGAWARSRA